MNDEKRNIFENEIGSATNRIASLGAEIGVLVRANALVGTLPEMADVSHLSINCYYDTPHVDLYLREDAADSKLAHAMARALRCRFEKTLDYSQRSFVLSSTVDGLMWNIHGYLGSCKLIQTEVPLTPEEYEAALNAVPKFHIKSRVECAGVGPDVVSEVIS